MKPALQRSRPVRFRGFSDGQGRYHICCKILGSRRFDQVYLSRRAGDYQRRPCSDVDSCQLRAPVQRQLSPLGRTKLAILQRAEQLCDDSIWRAYQRRRVISCCVKERSPMELRHDIIPLIGFARRRTEHKRPRLAIQRYREAHTKIARKRPFQVGCSPESCNQATRR